MCVALALAAPVAPVAAQTTPMTGRDVQVAARVLAFVQPPASAGAPVGVVFAPGSPALLLPGSAGMDHGALEQVFGEPVTLSGCG